MAADPNASLVDARLKELGIELPNFVTEPDYLFGKGDRRKGDESGLYGTYKPHHIVGNLLQLCGHVDMVGTEFAKGALGRDLTVDQGQQAARRAGINALGGVRHALNGDWDRLLSLTRMMAFVVCTPDFTDIHKVSSGASDLFIEVLGPERGTIARGTLGCVSLATNHCFELFLEAEIRP